ncbi:hypothetical protein Glove_310g27 [Diversispora epigaea]|uniref:Uncharacterized protein n=1 Tax=Diversispora epigaea TaxID=1348612 RepID=A0A397HWI4_9GLOM|nr:hypothetical protein Glove_310g27 [Diversispora epigaea]
MTLISLRDARDAMLTYTVLGSLKSLMTRMIAHDEYNRISSNWLLDLNMNRNWTKIKPVLEKKLIRIVQNVERVGKEENMWFKPMRDRNRCHAVMMLRYSVAKECKRIGEFDPILIRKVADHLWNTSTSQEKLEYANLAQRTTYPPPEIDEVLNCLCGTITDAVSVRYLDILLQRIGEFNATLVGQATNHLWKNSITQEKAEYFNLAHFFATEYLIGIHYGRPYAS